MTGGAIRPGRRWHRGAAFSRHGRPPSRGASISSLPVRRSCWRHKFGTALPGGKQRLYHCYMLGEDLSGRFDYLFEPLDVVESAGNGDVVAPRAPAQSNDDNRWSRRIVLAGAVLATIAP